MRARWDPCSSGLKEPAVSRHPLETAQPPVRRWFEAAFERPTRAQELGWPAIASGESTLLLAPTGSGKTLTAFLFALDRLLFAPRAEEARGVRVLYVSPLKALGADIERNLHAPIAGITAEAQRGGDAVHPVTVGMRTGDTPQAERLAQHALPLGQPTAVHEDHGRAVGTDQLDEARRSSPTCKNSEIPKSFVLESAPGESSRTLEFVISDAADSLTRSM